MCMFKCVFAHKTYLKFELFTSHTSFLASSNSLSAFICFYNFYLVQFAQNLFVFFRRLFCFVFFRTPSSKDNKWSVFFVVKIVVNTHKHFNARTHMHRRINNIHLQITRWMFTFCICIKKPNGHQSQLPDGFLPFNHFRIHSTIPFIFACPYQCVSYWLNLKVFYAFVYTRLHTNKHIFLSFISLSVHITISLYDAVCLKNA